MQNWDFWALTLGCTYKLFPLHREVFWIFKCCSSWTSQFVPVYDKRWKIVFFKKKTSLGCSPDNFEVPLISPSCLWSLLLIAQKMCCGQSWQINKEFRWKKMWFHSFRSSQFCSVSKVFALAWICRTNYVLEAFNILLSKGWLTKNRRTIWISNK